MQESLDLYLPFLSGRPKEIALLELRRFVAYPSNDEVKAGTPARLHLAVREVEIECAFPGVSVQALGLIDLPGTGENVAAGEDRHVAGLEDEVDVVLLVVKPPRVLEWDLECDATLDLIREARCGADAEDFAVLVLNSGGASAGQRGALRDHMERKLRDEDGRFKYSILEIDAKDSQDVRTRLTLPILEHLASRLPAMDLAAMHHAEAGWANLAADALALVTAVDRALASHVPVTTPAQLLVARKAHDLHGALAVALSRRVKTRFDAARLSAAEDPKFEEAVAACYQRVRAWVADGLGRGEAQFLDAALKAMTVDQASGYAGKELNRIRVHLASEFTSLDDHLAAKVEEVWAEVWSSVAPAFGRSSDVTPKDGLSLFATDLRAAGCTSLAAAIEDLLALRLDYRTHFHPRLRRKLDVLSAQDRDPESGAPRPRIAVEPDADGAHEMLRLLAEHGERAAHEAQNALLRDLSLPAEVLHAALEQFDDGFIRAGGADEEFHRYALERRDEIWPGTFDQLDQAHRLFSGCRDALSSARSVLSQVQGVSK